jgi:hypothetical protein
MTHASGQRGRQARRDRVIGLNSAIERVRCPCVCCFAQHAVNKKGDPNIRIAFFV